MRLDDDPNGRREKRPAFQMYPMDFLASSKVARMSAEERGVFTTILLRSWSDDGYELDVDDLAFELQLTPDRLRAILAGVVGRALYLDDEGRYRSKRLEAERNRARRKSAVLAENGKKGAEARAAKAAEEAQDAAPGSEQLLDDGSNCLANASNCLAPLSKGAGQGRAGLVEERTPPSDDLAAHSRHVAFAPPEHVPQDWLEKHMQAAEVLLSTSPRWPKVHAGIQRRILKLGVIQMAPDPPKGKIPPAWALELSHATDVGRKVAEWVETRIKAWDRTKGSLNAYLGKAAIWGPDSAGWVPPGTPQQPEPVRSAS